MKTYAIISQKGGAGKTTLTLNLAIAAEQRGLAALVVDIDPQASAAQWSDYRDDDSPVIISSQASRLDNILETAKENEADLVIIDTAPHSDNAALSAARVADLVLIPCRPSVLDLRAISQSVDIASLANKQAIVVINAAPPRGGLSDEARDVIAQYDVMVAPVTIAHRAAFYHSLTGGQTVSEYEPEGKAAQEILDLYNWFDNM